MAEPIEKHDGSYDADMRKEVPLQGVSMTKNNGYGQNPKKRIFGGNSRCHCQYGSYDYLIKVLKHSALET